MKSTALKLFAGGVPGLLIGQAICENFEEITEVLRAVISTFQ